MNQQSVDQYKNLKVGDNITTNGRTIGIGGDTIKDANSNCVIRDIVIIPSFWGRITGTWIPEQLVGFRIDDDPTLWLKYCFNESKNIR